MYELTRPKLVRLLIAIALIFAVFKTFGSLSGGTPASFPGPAPVVNLGCSNLELLNLNKCRDHVAKQPANPVQNWSWWSAKPETMHLRRTEYFGSLTANIDTFTKVYETKLWGDGSGHGSALHTKYVQSALCYLYWFIVSHEIEVLIDTSCGDQQWAPTLRKLLPSLDYIGIDVVPALIQYNRETFGVEGHIEFFLLDICEPDYFAKIAAHSKVWQGQKRVRRTLVLNRHTIYHMTNSDVARALVNFKKANSTWTAITHHSHVVNEREKMESGSFMLLNLLAHPFNFYTPILALKESYEFGDVDLAFWRRELFVVHNIWSGLGVDTNFTWT